MGPTEFNLHLYANNGVIMGSGIKLSFWGIIGSKLITRHTSNLYGVLWGQDVIRYDCITIYCFPYKLGLDILSKAVVLGSTALSLT